MRQALGVSRCRFAPTTSGPAHPGTLLAGLLAWLDARKLGAHFLLRLEDVDPARCTPESAADMRESLRWFGLDWDAEELQSANLPAHEAALDRLAELGLLYPCACSRSEISRASVRAADGGWRYTELCRAQSLPRGGWREADAALRFRVPDGRVELRDESGLDLTQDVRREMGDPVLRRRDGAIAYHLAVVVDDGRAGVTRIVRGRDLATSTATHLLLQRALGLATPTYRHHFLFLERSGAKLAKLHGAVGWRELAAAVSAEQIRAQIAAFAGLDLSRPFDWGAVRAEDLVLEWRAQRLTAAQ